MPQKGNKVHFEDYFVKVTNGRAGGSRLGLVLSGLYSLILKYAIGSYHVGSILNSWVLYSYS